MFGFTRKQAFIVLLALALKSLITTFAVPVSPHSDFANWVTISAKALSLLEAGRLPSIGAFGAYVGQATFLAPFFAAWQALPIKHTSIAQALSSPYSVQSYFLIFIMKLPILLFDFFAGLIVSLIAQTVPSKRLALKAFLLWYLNPYSFYLMEYGGTYDIVSTAFVLLSVLLMMRKKPIGAGLTLSIAAFLRLYPALILPVLVLFSLMRAPKRATVELLIAFFVPVAGVFFAEVYSGSTTHLLGSLLQALIQEPWLLDFIGIPIIQFLALTPFLLLVQLYLVARCWHAEMLSPSNLALSALLVILAMTYHHPYHLVWLLPLLTIFYLMNESSTLLFAFFLFSAYLYGLGYSTPDSLLTTLQPLFAGLFIGLKAVYLIKLNHKAIWPTFIMHSVT